MDEGVDIEYTVDTIKEAKYYVSGEYDDETGQLVVE